MRTESAHDTEGQQYDNNGEETSSTFGNCHQLILARVEKEILKQRHREDQNNNREYLYAVNNDHKMRKIRDNKLRNRLVSPITENYEYETEPVVQLFPGMRYQQTQQPHENEFELRVLGNCTTEPTWNHNINADTINLNTIQILTGMGKRKMTTRSLIPLRNRMSKSTGQKSHH